MRTFQSFLFLTTAMFMLAPDLGASSGGTAPGVTPQSNTRFRRKSDGAIVKAERYTEESKYVQGMSNAETGPQSPYVITKTGFREGVTLGDYVVTESDGEHYYTYPAEKFDAEYEAAPLDSSSTDDLHGTRNITQAEAELPDSTTAALPSNTLFAQSGDGALTPLGATPGSEPRVIPAANGTKVDSPAPGTPPLADELAAKDRKIAELDAWNKTASDALTAVDSYLFSVNPDLPKNYGMPVDGVRATVEKLQAKPTAAALTKGLGNPGTHSPSTPDAPTADEAAGALSTLLENFPKLYAGIIEPVKEMRNAPNITAEVKAKLNAAIAVIEHRFRNV